MQISCLTLVWGICIEFGGRVDLSFEGRRTRKWGKNWRGLESCPIKLELGVCVALDVICFEYVESIYEVGVCVIGASLSSEVGCVGYWC